MDGKVKIGLVGCGNISDIYIENCARFAILEAVACADLVFEKAEAKAQQHNLEARTVGDLLEDPEIQIVLDLTVPATHAEVNLAVLAAGKHVYSEKPLAVTRQSGQETLALAQARGLRVGCAPDTFLGAGLQTCRKLIDEGAIGEPVAASAFMPSHGPESWHPEPEFFYKTGAGPLFDMGPYYLTALISLLGPVQRVTGSARISIPERLITSQPHAGQKISVEVPTHVAGVLDFASGPVVTLITSFDIWSANLPRIEVYGTEGTLSVPDPNTFGGPVQLSRASEREWVEIPLTHGYANNSRGLGLADLAHALRSGRPQRAAGEMAFHVLDVMHAIHAASLESRHIQMASACERPEPLPVDLPEGLLDD
ncbi:MAG TPA: Gfo/Idh/MocA family oxidoreductase [Anaerolineales bacterium]